MDGNAETTRTRVGKQEVRILLVDDDETWVTSTARLLDHQREQFVVETATDVTTAQVALAETDPDCVVCDYQLETATGLDLLERIRGANDDRPFILITGQGSESVASDAIGREVTDYIPKRSLGGRNDLLARRIETAVETYRARQALARERRSKDAMLDILIGTSSQAGLVQRFCDHLVGERDYAGAWIGTTGRSSGVVPRGAAGVDGYLDAVLDPEGRTESSAEPALVALENGETHVVTPIEESTDGWRADAMDAGFGSVAATPVTHDGTTFGVLAVYGSGDDFEPEEVVLLEEYSETIGYALRSAGWRETLLSPTPVTLELELRDTALVALQRRLPANARLTVLTTVPQTDRLLYVLRAHDTTAEELRDGVADSDAVEDCTLTRTDRQLRCELTTPLPTPETVVTDRGGRITDVSVENGRASIRVVVREERDVQRFVDGVRSVYPDADLRSVRGDEVTTGQKRSILDSLTDKQRRAIEVAFFSGYFERPREHDTSEVAAKLEISRQTLTQHLRAAQRKLLSEFLDETAPATNMDRGRPER